MRFLLRIVILFCMCSVYSESVRAGVATVQPLTFGEYIMTNNDAAYDITINTNGTYSADPAAFIEVTPPEEGIYILDGMVPGTPVVSVSVSQFSPLSDVGETFIMVDFQESHSSPVDISGEVTVTIGATARSSGTGVVYSEGVHNGVVTIQVNF